MVGAADGCARRDYAYAGEAAAAAYGMVNAADWPSRSAFSAYLAVCLHPPV